MPEKSDNRDFDPIRILVLQTAFLGDIILTIPLILALKTVYPNSHLALLTTPAGREALQELPELDEIISYDKKKTEKGLAGFFRKARELRAKKFDLAVSPHRSFRSAFLLYLASIPVLAGFADSAFPWVYHLRVKPRKRDHTVLRNLSLLEPIAELPENFEPRIKLPAPENFALEKFGLSLKQRPLIGFAPGSAWPTKRWPAQRFGELAKILEQELGAKIVLLGDNGDISLCSEVERLSGAGIKNLAGKTGLKDLFGLISNLDCLVSNDSAPVHIASGFSIPTVVIFGPTSPAFGFGPRQSPHRILEKELSCRPCHHHGPIKCPEGHFRCMKDISGKEAADAVKELLTAN